MSITDKFLDIMRLNMDEDEYDDYDEDDFEEEVKPRRSSRTPKQSTRREEAPRRASKPAMEEVETVKETSRTQPRQMSKVVPMRNKKGNVAGMEVCVIKPTGIEDEIEIADTLLSGRAVILNMEGIHYDLAQRIIDFSSGACYAMSGNLSKISNCIFVITPSTVDISGDVPELLEGDVNVTSI